MFTKMKQTYHEFPETFWVISFSSFIDAIGNQMLMPFIALYMTETFGITMVEMGIVFIIVGLGNVVGSMIGGALTDKFGRKKIALFGLLVSGLFSLLFIFITNLTAIYILVGCMGLLGSMGGPARQAMIADVLPVKQRAEGFGILRVVVNLSATIAPALGGLLVGFDFKWLFLVDTLTSVITAIIFYFKIPETSPTLEKAEIEPLAEIEAQPIPQSEEKEAKNTKGGYGDVFRNWRFMIFVLVSAIMGLTYMQIISTLPVFLSEELLFSKQFYGLLISMNALMVVVLQFWITRRIKMFPALVMMAFGNILYGIGFGMYGFISTVPLAFLAMVILTVGEMVIAPFQQTLAANFAPEDKRGRYMAVHGWAEIFPMLFGIIGAGFIMDNLDRNIVWYLAGILSLVAALGYVFLHFVSKDYLAQLNAEEQTDSEMETEIPVESPSDTEVWA